MPTHHNEPTRRARAVAALGLGLIAMAVFLVHKYLGPHYVRGTAGDLGGALEGARRVLAGQRDIYESPFAPYLFAYAMEYPLTASLFILPLGLVPPIVAGAIFAALATGCAVWVLTRRGWTPLLMFTSAPAVYAWVWAQWSPWFLVQGLVSGGTLLILLKPQMGLVLFAYRPDWRGLAVAAAVGCVTLLWSPTWVFDWLFGQLSNAYVGSQHAGGLAAPGGFLLLAAAWRWRDPRARLLVALAVIPNRLWFYEQLVLGLVPQTRARMIAWVASTWVAVGLWAWARQVWGIVEAAVVREIVHVVFVYGPALYFVLRAPPAGVPVISVEPLPLPLPVKAKAAATVVPG